MEGKTSELIGINGIASLSKKNLPFEGFEGAFGSENFQDLSDTHTSNGSAADSQRESVSGSCKHPVTASPSIKYGYGVASSMLPTLSLSWFGSSADKNPSESKDSTITNQRDRSPESTKAPPDDTAAAVSDLCTLTRISLSFTCV